MNFGGFMAKITPAWKMRKLHLWWFHEVNGNAFRRIHAINEELFEKDARTYHCNMCGRVVFKGSIKYGIVMNCPNCGCQFGVALDFPHKAKIIFPGTNNAPNFIPFKDFFAPDFNLSKKLYNLCTDVEY